MNKVLKRETGVSQCISFVDKNFNCEFVILVHTLK